MLNEKTWACPCNDDSCSMAYVGDRIRIDTKDSRVVEGVIIKMDENGMAISCGNDDSFVSFITEFIDWNMMEHKTLLSRGKKETVSHPNHYQSETGLEAWDAIAAVTFDLKGVEAFDTGNIIKYMWRWKHKNGLEDLRKAKQYLEHLIAHVENLKKGE